MARTGSCMLFLVVIRCRAGQANVDYHVCAVRSLRCGLCRPHAVTSSTLGNGVGLNAAPLPIRSILYHMDGRHTATCTSQPQLQSSGLPSVNERNSGFSGPPHTPAPLTPSPILLLANVLPVN